MAVIRAGLEPISWFDPDLVDFSGTTSQSVSESFSLGEAAAISATLASVDSTALTDAASLANALGLTDTLAHTDAAALANAAATVESGSFSDAAALANALAASDSWTASEAAALANALGLTDTLAHTDAVALANAAATVDSGSFSDAGSLANAVSVSDNWALGEAAALAVALVVSDAVTVTDSGIVQLPVVASDSSTVGEAVSIAAATAVAETVAFTDVASILASVAATDTATHGESALAGEFADKTPSDSWVVSEITSLANAVAANDSMAIADSTVSLAATLAVTDPVALTEAAALLATLSTADSLTHGEATALIQTAGISASDAVTLSESAALFNAIGVTDAQYLRQSLSPYFALVNADAPVGYWRLGESSGSAAVDQLGTHNGVYTSATYSQAGAIVGDADTSVSFAGTTTSGIAVSGFPEFINRLPFTIEMWVKRSTANQTNFRTIACHENGTAGWRLSVRPSTPPGNDAYFARVVGGTEQRASAGQPPLDADGFDHVVGTYDGNQVALYVNGQLRGSAADTRNTVASSTNLRIGRGVATTSGWGGNMDEVAIYDYALTPVQVASHFNAGYSAYGELAGIDLLELKAATDNWVFSEFGAQSVGSAAPFLRLPLTAAVVLRVATASVIKNLAAAAVTARLASAAVDRNAADAEVPSNLGSVSLEENKADATITRNAADAEIPYG